MSDHSVMTSDQNVAHCSCGWSGVPNRAPLPPCPIDATESVSANRNDPCTCGSGKKYKKCCL